MVQIEQTRMSRFLRGAWSSRTAAFETLSHKMQTFLSGLTGQHDVKGASVYRDLDGAPRGFSSEQEGVLGQAEHAIVRTHPEAVFGALYVNRACTTDVIRMKAQASRAPLDVAFEHQEILEFVRRFVWRVGSRWCFGRTDAPSTGDTGLFARMQIALPQCHQG